VKKYKVEYFGKRNIWSMKKENKIQMLEKYKQIFCLKRLTFKA